MWSEFIKALIFSQSYNASIVMFGASLLGAAAGAVGTFLVLRKKALVSDAVAHATLPGIALAFIIMVSFGIDSRNLFGLLIGAASAGLIGLMAISFLNHNTRLSEDSAIGAVLSVFFGFGVVLLTLIQNFENGQQAGLEGFLLGATAGMLLSEAMLILYASLACILLIVLFHRPMLNVSFDQNFAQSIGISVVGTDFIIMGLAMSVTVIGLKIVGLILIVAMLIIPPVAARFWTNRPINVILIASFIGALAAYIGTAISVAVPNSPTGPLIVLVNFALFLMSFLCAHKTGILANFLKQREFQYQVHLKQGLLALARQDVILDKLTLSILTKQGFLRPDGVETPKGKAQAAKTMRDEARWSLALELFDTVSHQDQLGLNAIEDELTPDQLTHVDKQLKAAKQFKANSHGR